MQLVIHGPSQLPRAVSLPSHSPCLTNPLTPLQHYSPDLWLFIKAWTKEIPSAKHTRTSRASKHRREDANFVVVRCPVSRALATCTFLPQWNRIELSSTADWFLSAKKNQPLSYQNQSPGGSLCSEALYPRSEESHDIESKQKCGKVSGQREDRWGSI